MIEPNAGLAARADWVRHYSRGAAWGVYVITLVMGFFNGASRAPAVQVLSMLGVAWAITLFCALDARAHQKPFPLGVWRIYFITWPLAPLFHFVNTRGMKGALMYVLHAAALLFCLLTSAALGSQFR